MRRMGLLFHRIDRILKKIGYVCMRSHILWKRSIYL